MSHTVTKSTISQTLEVLCALLHWYVCLVFIMSVFSRPPRFCTLDYILAAKLHVVLKNIGDLLSVTSFTVLSSGLF